MKMKKILVLGILLSTMVLILAGCKKTSSKSFVYNVETGDSIEIEMDTYQGYDISATLPAEFSKDGQVISKGTFGKETAYDTYYELVKADEDAKIIEEKSKDNIEYFFYNYNNEYNYIIKIKDSKTCFVLGCDKGQESAQDIFGRLKFRVVK